MQEFFVRCLFLVAVVGCLFAPRAIAQDRPPNIVLILADDLGYGDVSFMGFADDIETPNIDALAERGVRFGRFYANCPVCSPTRASLLTGRYPDRVGVPGVVRQNAEDNWGYLHPDAVLIPAVLREAGYHTALVGKWHLGYAPPNTPNTRGFDHFHGFLGDMMDDYYDHRRGGENWMRLNNEVIDPEGHATDLFSQWAVDYIAERAEHDAPFFLFLSYNAPHTPIQPPDDWLARVQGREPGVTQQRAKLVALIEHMDHGIGEVLEALDATGEAENTLIVFTSDNGGQLNVGANNGPLRAGKGTLYEGGVRVPFVAAWPGHITPGTVNHADAMTMDVFPTLCELAGLESPNNLDGRSMLALLTGGAGDVEDAERADDAAEDGAWPERDLFWVRREGWGYMGQEVRAVRRGPWKLVQNDPFAPFELFNLDADPLESDNVADQHRDVFRDLSRALQRQMQRAGAVPWQAAE